MEGQSLIIFVKAPVPGKVKTRLVPPLTYEEASLLYRTWAADICDRARSLKSISLLVAYDPHPDYPTPDWLGFRGEALSFFQQRGENLGERILHAFSYAFKRGAERALVIGTDSPGLPIPYIDDAFDSLMGSDLVLGPTPDGGCYLIGARRNPAPALFQNVLWSTRQVFLKIIENAAKLNLSVCALPEYFDVDRPEDLLRLQNSPS